MFVIFFIELFRGRGVSCSVELVRVVLFILGLDVGCSWKLGEGVLSFFVGVVFLVILLRSAKYEWNFHYIIGLVVFDCGF